MIYTSGEIVMLAIKAGLPLDEREVRLWAGRNSVRRVAGFAFEEKDAQAILAYLSSQQTTETPPSIPAPVVVAPTPTDQTTQETAFEDPASTEQDEVLRMEIDDLELSVRAYNCLHDHGIQTVGQLLQRTSYDLLRFRHFGRVTLHCVQKELAQHGLALKGESPPPKIVMQEDDPCVARCLCKPLQAR